MAEDIVLLLLGSLVVGPIAWWLQQGSIRQRRRREILGDLELVEKLHGTRPDATARINTRIDRALKKYAPARPARFDPLRWTIGTGVVLFVTFIAANETLDVSRPVQLAAGGCIAIAANLAGVVVDAIAQRRINRTA